MAGSFPAPDNPAVAAILDGCVDQTVVGEAAPGIEVDADAPSVLTTAMRSPGSASRNAAISSGSRPVAKVREPASSSNFAVKGMAAL